MPGSPSPVRVQTEGNLVTISLHGRLDATAGHVLLDSLRHELDRAPTRVSVDLLAVDAFTDAGAQALRQCQALAVKVPDGLTFRTGAGAGHEALLAAYEADDVETA